MSSKINTYLSKFRVDKTLDKADKIYTNAGLGKNMGSYNIPVQKRGELFDLIAQYMFKDNISITEINEPNTNIKIDIDFKYTNKDQIDDHFIRVFDDNFMKNIVKNYNNSIIKFLSIDDNMDYLQAFVMTRDYPYMDKNGNVKDGIHIVYPFIICDYKIQELIRLDALNSCKLLVDTLEGIVPENISKIIDPKVIQDSGWFLYGCSKPMTEPYKINMIIDHEINELENSYSNRELIELLSVRNHNEDEYLHLREDRYVDLDEYKLTKIKKARAKVEQFNTQKFKQDSSFKNISISDEQIEYISLLVGILSEERATNYTTWVQVGFCLYNISTKLYPLWIEFSKKAKNFDEESCILKWETLKNGTLGLGSLHLWAQADSPAEYKNIISNNLRIYIERSSSKMSYDIAKVIYEMYKYKYKYVPSSSKSGGVWYEFYNHRWHECKEAISLLNHMSNEVFKEYNGIILQLGTIIQSSSNEESIENNINKVKPLSEITYHLRDMPHKKKFLSECSIMFADHEFENKLDTNIYLLGFENGVYDLKNEIFRDGTPEDYLTMTTGIDYCVFKNDHEYIGEIYSFFKQVFVDEDKRNYVLRCLGSMLEGINASEKFHIWTGVGGNGKSKMVQLLESCFGDYIKRVPTSLFTQGNKGSGNATPELARLVGVRIITAQETNKDDNFNISLVKEYSGNDKIYYRGLFKDGAEMIPQFKIIFCCNHKPGGLDDDDEGIWRRMSIVEYTSRFVDNPDPKNKYEFPRDNYLAEKLIQWKEAFAYLLIEYYKEYKREGLVEPKCVINATKDYRRANDNISDFILDKIKDDEYSTCKLEDTYKIFCSWWRDSVDKNVPKKMDFKKSIEKKWGVYNALTGWKGKRVVTESENINVPIESGAINIEHC